MCFDHANLIARRYVYVFVPYVLIKEVRLQNNFVFPALSVRCYQCASFQDPKGEDTCGAYKKFDRNSHVAVECNSDESHTPGSFCMKLTQQGPKGFICKYIVLYIQTH